MSSDLPQRDLDAVILAKLRTIADHALARERPGHTLQPTALVHEAYLALSTGDAARWRSRTHFFALAARCMRHILVDHARRRAALRRGGGQPLQVEAPPLVESDERGVDLLELEDALEALRRVSERGARIVELRFFGGLTEVETAEVLAISERTLRREWTMARAWLRRELSS